MPKDFRKARKMLLEACTGYIQHNQSELNKLVPRAERYSANDYFIRVINKLEPAPGFHNWIVCQYTKVLKGVLEIFEGEQEPFGKYERTSYPFSKIKGWGAEDKWDHSDPSVVLYNLQAIFNLFDHYMKENIPDLDEKKSLYGYEENDLIKRNTVPLSTQITMTLENLKLRALLWEKIMEPHDHNKKSFDGYQENKWRAKEIPIQKLINKIKCLYLSLNTLSPDFECYIKGVAVKELKSTLENPDLNDKAAISRVEAQLRDGRTLELLQKNRQSGLEKGLKLLSVITLLIGIGIFPTLFLACKRLYDSGGTSINFFKPLSKNLCETMQSVTEELQEGHKGSYNTL